MPAASFGRAVAAFVALPGVVAFAVPLLVGFWSRPVDPRSSGLIALVPGVPGVALLLWCVREFHVAGRGTLAPWAPPSRLVVTGPYRRSRNPMYVAVLLVLCGWTLVFRSAPLGWYTAAVGLAFHVRVVHGEEPRLARTFGEQWDRYRAQVRRWV